MAGKPDVSQYQTFEQLSDRLNQIVAAVRSKDVSLERSLDLFDEAIALGSKAVDMVDTTALSDAEKERLADAPAKQDGEKPSGEAGTATETTAGSGEGSS